MAETFEIVLVTGGARSGKSSTALQMAECIPGSKAFIATARAEDSEMLERIQNHQKDRGPHWKTYECPVNLKKSLNGVLKEHDVVVVDCLTLWISNLLFDLRAPDRVNDEITDLIEHLKKIKDSLRKKKLFFVTNEVGMGIVPDNTLSRLFRDIAGRANQLFAQLADEVYLVVAGIAMKIK